MRHFSSYFRLALAALAAIMISACEVEQTQEGEMPDVDASFDAGELPEYDVDVEKTEEGRAPDMDVDVEGGQLPEYDVEGPDVDVTMEEETVTVPNIDVDMPDEEEDEPR